MDRRGKCAREAERISLHRSVWRYQRGLRERALEIFVRLADKRLPGSRDDRDHGGVAHICASAESNQKGGIAKQMLRLMRSSFLDSIISGENAKWAPVDRSTELHARSVPDAVLINVDRDRQYGVLYAYSFMPV